MRYLLPAPSAPLVRTYTVAAQSRRTIPVDEEPGLDATDVSADIHSTNGVPIIVERAMYSRPAASRSAADMAAPA